MGNNPLTLTTYAVDFTGTALEASSVTKASRGYLGKVFGRIDSTAGSATYYFQILNAASLPADGTVTFLISPLKIIHTNGVNSTFDIDFTPQLVPASSGIVWCVSSTEFTKTITAANASVTVLYK